MLGFEPHLNMVPSANITNMKSPPINNCPVKTHVGFHIGGFLMLVLKPIVEEMGYSVWPLHPQPNKTAIFLIILVGWTNRVQI